MDLSVPTFYNLINGKSIILVSVRKLKRLLNYLCISYAYINNKIDYTKKGSKISIKCNKFPINLLSESGAKLLGHVVSDGCIYLDKKARTIRTKYSSDDESVRNFINYLKLVYGEVCVTKERVRNCSIIKIGSAIVGNSLLKCGAILGHKAKMNKRVPWLIRFGENKLKRAYLSAVFDDESCIYLNKNKCSQFYITLSRYRHLNKLTDEQKGALITLEKFMKDNKFPTGHLNKRISMKRAIENLGRHRELLKNINSAPRLLVDESAILNQLGIENRLWGSSLNKTHAGNYSVGFDLFVRKKEAIKKFYKEVGFSLKHKQDKLVKALGGKNCIKILQHAN